MDDHDFSEVDVDEGSNEATFGGGNSTNVTGTVKASLDSSRQILSALWKNVRFVRRGKGEVILGKIKVQVTDEKRTRHGNNQGSLNRIAEDNPSETGRFGKQLPDSINTVPLISPEALQHMIKVKPQWWLDGLGLDNRHAQVLSTAFIQL
mmetsp:Transcript_28010/g.68191  ORF Transcript_28010/g.68191 Transcript_28010/m.68191 type:complete len:150 (-) Transcript_28010:507-956(-)